MLDTLPPPDTAAAQVASDRNRLADALSALRGRIKAAPKELVPRLLERPAKQALHVATSNPLPVGMIAVGAVWLWATMGKKTSVHPQPTQAWDNQTTSHAGANWLAGISTVHVLAGLLAGAALAMRTPSTRAEQELTKPMVAFAMSAGLQAIGDRLSTR